jgi:Uma2 family endonuclease
MRTKEAFLMAVMHEDRIAYHRITVDQYYRMAEVGVLALDERVELIDGVIIDMAPIGSRHAGTSSQLGELLLNAVGTRAILRSQSPIRFGSTSEPQPDLALLRRRHDYYKAAHPIAEDALLLVEVSDTSARYDVKIKVPLYARHRIPEVWVVDLPQELLHIYRRPEGGVYADISALAEPGVVTLAALPDVEVDLTGIVRG